MRLAEACNHMKNTIILLNTVFCLLLSSLVFAQHVVKKGDITIQIKGYALGMEHLFYLDIYKKRSSATIVYSYLDSVKFAESRKDTLFSFYRAKLRQYPLYDPRGDAITDTVLLLYEKHSDFTRDSIAINLKTDTAYRNLLQRFSNATKEELAPKVERTWLDGYSILVDLITDAKRLKVDMDTPHALTHSLLFEMINGTLNKSKNSGAVNKILKQYNSFK
jgi:hypothetical protein